MDNWKRGGIGFLIVLFIWGVKSTFKRGLSKGFLSIFKDSDFYSHGTLNDLYLDYALIYGLVLLLIIILIVCMIKKIKQYNDKNL